MPEHKIAIVTGGERGIGLAITRQLLASHYRVVVAGMDEASAEKNIAPLEGAQFIRCDVGVEADVAAMAAQVLAEHGAIHALVANAGLADPYSPPVEELSLEQWERVLRVNLTGAFLSVKHCLPALRKVRGAIVLISSTRAHASEPNTEAYSTSKAGMLGLTHSLANSCGPDVRVNAICPGWVNVDDFVPTPEEDAIQLTGKVGKPVEIATTAAFLLDNAQSGFITGQHLDVDGGVSAKLGYT